MMMAVSVVTQLDDRTVDRSRGEIRLGGEVMSLTVRENEVMNYFYVNIRAGGLAG